MAPTPQPAAPPSATAAPVEAACKIVGLASATASASTPPPWRLHFYGTSLPLSFGRGTVHSQPYASGDFVALGEGPEIPEIFAALLFDAASRTYEIELTGGAARIDGYDYEMGSLVRVGSGSCVRTAHHHHSARWA